MCDSITKKTASFFQESYQLGSRWTGYGIKLKLRMPVLGWCGGPPWGHAALRNCPEERPYLDPLKRTVLAFLVEVKSQLPSGKLTVCHWNWSFIVDVPIKNGGFHSYSGLPEGRGWISTKKWLKKNTKVTTEKTNGFKWFDRETLGIDPKTEGETGSFRVTLVTLVDWIGISLTIHTSTDVEPPIGTQDLFRCW